MPLSATNNRGGHIDLSLYLTPVFLLHSYHKSAFKGISLQTFVEDVQTKIWGRLYELSLVGFEQILLQPFWCEFSVQWWSYFHNIHICFEGPVTNWIPTLCAKLGSHFTKVRKNPSQHQSGRRGVIRNVLLWSESRCKLVLRKDYFRRQVRLCLNMYSFVL